MKTNLARFGNIDFLTTALAAGYCAVVGILFFTPAGGRLFAGHVSVNLNYYRKFGEAAAAGLLPYRDVAVEYPPLGAAWLWAMAPFSKDLYVYYAVFAVGMFAVSVAGLLAALKLSEILAGDGAKTCAKIAVAAAYTFIILAAGPVGMVSLDYIPMALSAWAMVELARGKRVPAFALLAAATAAKGFPVVLLPLFLAEAAMKSGKRGALEGAAAFVAVSALLFGIPALLSPDGVAGSFAFHAARGVEKHSAYGAVLLTLGLAGANIPPAMGNLSWPPGESAATDLAMKLSAFALALLVARAYGAYATALQRRPALAPEAPEPDTQSVRRLLVASALILTAATIGFKISSPQFLSWSAPALAALATQRRGIPRLALFAAAGFASQWLFPWNFDALTHGFKVSTAFMTSLKTAALIGIYIDLAADAAGKKPGGAGA
ncbi:MAG: hypothetical protein BWY28_00871 [bacterium ADurb.Bin236]|nr:MAG: hypothetical protein BWY28_00871 [bacterium ADurb.Bin236]HOY61807.1 hypothetical protein [bacterium]HPN94790.1 hypothetical protein [bacterium]